QELLQRVAVGHAQERERDVERARTEHESPADARVPCSSVGGLQLSLAAGGVGETHGRRQRIRDGSSIDSTSVGGPNCGSGSMRRLAATCVCAGVTNAVAKLPARTGL